MTKSAEIRTLLIVRHAHRELVNRAHDNGLSAKGQEQAQKFMRYFLKNFSSQIPLLESSPRLRSQDTLEPLSMQLKIPIKINLLLEEQSADSEKSFVNRIEAFLKQWENAQSRLVVACSHGDWIPIFLKKAVGEAFDLKKGAMARLELKGSEITELKGSGKIKLVDLVQSF